MKRWLTILTVACLCGHAADKTTKPPDDIDIGTAKLEEYRKAYPDKPALAEYQYRLQCRIDQLFFEESRLHHFSGGNAVGIGHSFSILVTVLADGRVGADKDELKLKLAQEPVLAQQALSALANITGKPEPFSATLKKEIGGYFVYRARFTVR